MYKDWIINKFNSIQKIYYFKKKIKGRERGEYKDETRIHDIVNKFSVTTKRDI